MIPCCPAYLQLLLKRRCLRQCVDCYQSRTQSLCAKAGLICDLVVTVIASCCSMHQQQNVHPQVVCTLGPKSRSVPMLEELLKAGMAVARFNFSHGSYEYHQVGAERWHRQLSLLQVSAQCYSISRLNLYLQETLDNLRAAMRNTRILCAVMLDTKVC